MTIEDKYDGPAGSPIADYAILKLGKGEQDFKYDETMIARMEMDVYNQVEEGDDEYDGSSEYFHNAAFAG